VPNSTAKRRILVAEDNDSARMILADLLRMLGYQVDEVAHGMAAVEAVRAQRYDLVLMDCHMPVMDGLDATRTIRRTEGADRLIILAVTGEDNREDCLAAGMDDYLTKPVRPQLLRTTVARWLERGGRTSEPPPMATPVAV
jgi:CheY-like chemotaxis protein